MERGVPQAVEKGMTFTPLYTRPLSYSCLKTHLARKETELYNYRAKVCGSEADLYANV